MAEQMNEHKCEKCEHEKECLNMVCFYELLEKEEGKIRAEEREKTIEECKEVVRQHWINGTVAYRIAEEIYGSLERLKEQTGEGRKVD